MLEKKIRVLFDYLPYLLYLIRVVLGFSHGYIHPDEHFQHPNVVTKYFFPKSTQDYTCWEYDPENPQRNVFFPFIFSGLPMLFAKYSSFNRSAVMIMFSPKIFMLIISFLSEKFFLGEIVRKLYCSTRKKLDNDPKRIDQVRLYMLLWNCMWVVIIFHSRTFSNTLEAIFTILLLYTIVNYYFEDKKRNFLLGCVFCFGVFNRFTFCFFAFVPVMFSIIGIFEGDSLRKRGTILSFLKDIFRRENFYRILVHVLFFTIGFSAVFVFLVTVDSLYYQNGIAITPMNNFLYNLDPKNLSLHTLHPFYLHIFVNFPLLFLPQIVMICVYLKKLLMNRSKLPRLEKSVVTICTLSVVFNLVMISMAPHQELRFIIPNSVFIFLVMCSLCSESITRLRIIVIISLIFSVPFVIFFGVLHQSGVTRSLLSVHRERAIYGNVAMIYYKTYSPPFYLNQFFDRNLVVVDMVGRQSVEELVKEIRMYPEDRRTCIKIYYPASVEQEISKVSKLVSGRMLKIRRKWFLHLSTEDFPKRLQDLALIERSTC